MAQSKTSSTTTPFNPWTYALELSTEVARDQAQRFSVLSSQWRQLEGENRERAQRVARFFGTVIDESLECASQVAAEWHKAVLASFVAARVGAESLANAGK